MSTEDKPSGLKIRRRKDQEAEAAAEAAKTDAANAPPAEPVVAAPLAAPPKPRLISEAPAKPPVAAPAPAPAVRAPTMRTATAAPEDSKRSKGWRSEAAKPRMPKKAEPVEQREPRGELPTTDDFAAMLGGTPMLVARHEIGDKVTATVVAIGKDSVFVSLGAKAEGAMDSSELLDAEGELTVKIGDEVEAYVISMHDGVKLSRALSRGGENAQMVNHAFSNQIPVEGKVLESNKGGYSVEVLGIRAFCPFSQIDLNPGSEPEDHIGANYTFLVTRVEEDGRNVVVSRRKLMEAEREDLAVATLEAIAPGAVFEGVVSRVTDFGAFVDLGGVDGLVHISEMSWARLDTASEMVTVGDVVRVTVLSSSDLHDPKHRRIALSMKAMQEDPWVAGVSSLHPGDTVTGKVARLERFGAFVEIGPGLDGLVHISEISPGRRINHPQEVLTVGDSVSVQIIRVDPIKRQIALSIKALMDDPWGVAARDLPVGSAIQGTVDSIQSFGIFVELPGGINGLLPMSQLPDDEAKSVHTRFRAGSPIEARVLAVDAARRRLTLSRREDTEAEGNAAFAAYQQKTKAESSSGMATFADLLKKR